MGIIGKVGKELLNGRLAHQHLTVNLAMQLVKGQEAPELTVLFESWLRPYAAAINVHPPAPNSWPCRPGSE